ncbi:TIGR03086 family metal-binding protein [Nakamurella sp. PAMC28650]|uniref:TIGR03086 family metal-binding protein n=1 Tax=Nakamurella sp. PAMC28650 TaxID=2762325 RepID=UPI00164EC09B|nr:TIGR03086 family metal-binding protein [Nakamurella sp. PAMC28650]QNK81766.1 TIGR03086 family protein [Nakamurella sp. PAMC28650]
MDVLTAHRSGLRQFSNRVEAIREDQWQNPTPDTEWDVSDLVQHLVYEQLWVPRLFDGETIAQIGDSFEGDVLGDDPKAAWGAAAIAARAAVEAPGAMDQIVHLSFGDVPAEVYVWQMTVDLVVHSWDLAKAIRADDQMPNDIVSAVLEQAKVLATDWQGTGLFAAPIPVPGCTDDLTELLALLGRAR